MENTLKVDPIEASMHLRMGFAIERRGEHDIISWPNGGCRVATPEEATLWHALASATAALTTTRDTLANVNKALPRRCDGLEQDAFEAWGTRERLSMDTHPLHWLFLDETTAAARKGWAAGLEYALTCALTAATPPAYKGHGTLSAVNRQTGEESEPVEVSDFTITVVTSQAAPND